MFGAHLGTSKDSTDELPSSARSLREDLDDPRLEAMVRWLAPIASFTAEEIWQYMPAPRGESVLFETWYGDLAALQGSPAGGVCGRK